MRALTALFVAVAVLACGAPTGKTAGDAGAAAGLITGTAPEFSLRDVNPASPRLDQQVKPSDYRGQVSGWYFGHSS